MLKMRNFDDCSSLYSLMIDPAIYPFVREKVLSLEDFISKTNENIKKEKEGQHISRTITNEEGVPIGMISLFDIVDGSGFLGTWIGSFYQGKGYNRKAKECFFDELFSNYEIDKLFLKIRKLNGKSKRAAEKLPYVSFGNELEFDIYQAINPNESIFDLYVIYKNHYLDYKKEMVEKISLESI